MKTRCAADLPVLFDSTRLWAQEKAPQDTLSALCVSGKQVTAMQKQAILNRIAGSVSLPYCLEALF